jgi:hypothetical protein
MSIFHPQVLLAASEAAPGKIEIATVAEIQAGSSNLLAVSPGRLLSAQGFTEIAESAEIAVAANSLSSFAHGLGVFPKLVTVILRNKTAEGGWLVGNEVSLNDTDAVGSWGLTVGCDATNVLLALAGTPRLVNNTTFAIFAITVANWRFVVRAWA